MAISTRGRVVPLAEASRGTPARTTRTTTDLARRIGVAAVAALLATGAANAEVLSDRTEFQPTATTIDFETDGAGAAVSLIEGETRILPADEYQASGFVFDRALNWVNDGNNSFDAAQQLGSADPTIGGSLDNAIPSAAVDTFEIVFTDPVEAFGFFVAHNTAEDPTGGPRFVAYDESGAVVDSAVFSDGFPGAQTIGIARYGFVGIRSEAAPIKRVTVVKTFAILDDLVFGDVGERIGACCVEDEVEGGFDCTDDVLEADCLASGGSFAGSGVACAGFSCVDEFGGACCLDVETCLDGLAPGECEDTDGAVFAGAGTDCASVVCGEVLGRGACCVDVACTDNLTEQECLDAGGTYVGDASLCAQTNCGEVNMLGACCIENAEGGGFLCSDALSAADCASSGGAYLGDGTACAESDCDSLVEGACCLPDTGDRASICLDAETQASCDALGGVYAGDQSECAQVDCSTLLGACCFDDACTDDASPALCSDAGGVFAGAGTTCSAELCDDQLVGACCLTDACVESATRGECADLQGVFLGDGTDCSGNPCSLPTGACCLAAVCADGLTEDDCVGQGGVYAGDGAVCDTNPCGFPTGACCFDETESCIDDLTADQCFGQGGRFIGSNTDCASNDCQFPTGACCIGDACSDGLTETDCENAGGEYQGDGSACDTTDCGGQGETGACCFGDCECVDGVTADDCLSRFGGIFQGDATTCLTADCSRCPDANGNGEVDSNDLTILLNSFGAVGEDLPADFNCNNEVDSNDLTILLNAFGQQCPDVPQSGTGACCLPDGACQEGFTEDQCVAAQGVYQGDNVACVESACVGACCYDDCMCVDAVDRVECEDLMAGLYRGDGSTCAAVLCVRCPDLNGNGIVDSNDVTLMLNAFGQIGEDIVADVDCNGVVDSFDLTVLLNAFGQSCDTFQPPAADLSIIEWKGRQGGSGHATMQDARDRPTGEKAPTGKERSTGSTSDSIAE